MEIFSEVLLRDRLHEMTNQKLSQQNNKKKRLCLAFFWLQADAVIEYLLGNIPICYSLELILRLSPQN